jgi:hypothetical protein
MLWQTVQIAGIFQQTPELGRTLPSPLRKPVDVDLEAHFAHLFQKELASTINLHLDRFR